MSQVMLGARVAMNDSANTYGNLPGIEKYTDSAGNEFIFGQASAAVSQFACCTMDSGGNINQFVSGSVASGYKIGFAQVALTSGYYGWIQVKGNLTGLVLAANAANTPLYSCASAGYLGTATSGQTEIKGIMLMASATAAGSAAMFAPYEVQPNV